MPHRLKYIDRTQTLPFPGASDLHFRLARSFSLVTAFAAAMNDHMTLHDVVGGLTRQTGAANLAIYRMSQPDGTVRVISSASRSTVRTTPERPCGALARHLLERHGDSALPGSIWRLSELREDPNFAGSDAAREWDRRPHVCEVSLIVLEHTRSHIDLIEVQFETLPRRTPDLPTCIVAAALAETWCARQSGIVTRYILEQRRGRSDPGDASDMSILAAENPYGLSRCEQRVCQLLREGMKPVQIATALGVTISTIRTHLRNIYGKTGASGQVEVMARLLAAPGPDQPFQETG